MRTEAERVAWPFRGLPAFFRTEALVQLHEELAMATSMMVQVVLLIFVWILNPGLIGIALVGAVIFSMFSMGQRVLNEAAYIRIDHKANELYLAGPLSAEAYFLGMSTGILAVYVPPVIAVAILAALVIHATVPILLMLAGLSGAVWLFSASIGYVFSTAFRDNRAIWAYSSLFFNVFGVLPPVFYPFHYFPAPLHPVVLLMPPSAATALLQHAIGATALTPAEIVLAVTGLAVETLGLFLFAIYWARRTVRER